MPLNVAEAKSADAPFLANDYSICYSTSEAWTTSLGWLSVSTKSSVPSAIPSSSQLKHTQADEESQTTEASAIHNHQRLHADSSHAFNLCQDSAHRHSQNIALKHVK